MRRFVDLHTHSCASDGDLSPAQLVLQAERRRLAAVALTDHDTVSGLDQARRSAEGLPLRFVCGVELSAQYAPISGSSGEGVLHILGLGIDPANGVLGRVLRDFREARRRRNPKMLARLRRLGIDVSMQELLETAGVAAADRESVVGRLHMARLMVRKGYVRDTREAFDRYLGAGRPAFVDKERFTAEQAIAAIHAAGGLAVLAHPVQLGADNAAQLRRFVRRLRGWGLDGIEAYHPDHSDQHTRQYLDLARREGLLVSGGSDYHGGAKPGVRLGRPRVPLAAVEQLLARLAV